MVAMRRECRDAPAKLVPAQTEVLAGLELGGIPLVTALARETGLPAAFVRKEAKSYGTCRLSEGSNVVGRRVLLVEDVVTSGGQVARSATQLRTLGAEVFAAICVIDREAGGADLLAKHDLPLLALFTRSDLEATVG